MSDVPLLWDLRLAGVRGLLALRLPVKDFVAVIINNNKLVH